MTNEIVIITEEDIRNKIYVIRGIQVMLDSDLAKIYGYTTKSFNQQVQKNIERFDDDFRFQLTENEYKEILRSQFVTSNLDNHGGRRYLPYVFTEDGIHNFFLI